MDLATKDLCSITPICCPGGWRLVLVGGRFTLPAESRYSPTEGECLAVAVGLEQSKFYTLGCPRLYIATDHKPLVGILCDRALDTIANPRIVSIKERTLWWNFEILYVEGKSQQAADALSRKKFSAAASVSRLQMITDDDSRVVSQAQFQIGAAPQKAENRNKIGATSREVPQKAENRSKIGATSRGGAVKNAPFNVRKKQRTYEKFEFLAQTPLIITFYCISKL